MSPFIAAAGALQIMDQQQRRSGSFFRIKDFAELPVIILFFFGREQVFHHRGRRNKTVDGVNRHTGKSRQDTDGDKFFLRIFHAVLLSEATTLIIR